MNDQKWLIGGIVGILLLCMCVSAACLTAGGLAAFSIISETGSSFEEDNFPRAATVEIFPDEPTDLPPDADELKPTPEDGPTGESQLTAVPGQGENQAPAGQGADETLRALEEEIVPINDPRELAVRLEGKDEIPETLETPAEPRQVGDRKTFWASNVETNENFRVEAVLRYATEHLYFWIEDGVRYNERDLQRLAETFEEQIYPINREFFGSEWSPGIDNDPHLYVLYARGLGRGIAGYFSAADELHPEAHEYSNAHEMFMISADNVSLGEEYIYGTMAHEFQHMIHWYRDRNEESWMNEGFAVLAEFLNDYDIGGFDFLYVSDPDLQLTHWPSPPESTPHYGQSFLFLAYFLDRFGDDATKALVSHDENGMESIDEVLSMLQVTDPRTNAPVTADDVFADWVVASFLNDPDVEDGRYAYQRYETAPSPYATEEIEFCSPEWQERTVNQYGVDYIQVFCPGEYTLHFEGLSNVRVLPEGAYSGNYAFWSNKGDESNMVLAREFDFTQVSGPLTLNFRTWYDIEEDYDYLYLVASTDGGETWQIIQTPSGTDEDPSGNSYGWAYNGQTNGWIEESVDLSQFAGEEVILGFEYVTDAAVNGEGFLLDDIQIPEINYQEDFEQDEGGWNGDGFVRIQNRLPQTFRVALIRDGETISVENITLDENNSAEIELDLTGDMRSAVLVVSGVTRFTIQEAEYRFSFEER